MMRLACALLLGLLSPAAAAPVPRQRPPEPALTADLLVGDYAYEWNGCPDGILCINKDGTYGAMHHPTGRTAYHGTWTLAGAVVTLEEYGYDVVTGAQWGPTTYRFDFTGSALPKLVGKSNGSGHVALTRSIR